MEALTVAKEALSLPDQQRLRKWLRQPEARMYREYLSGLTALQAAIIANHVVLNDVRNDDAAKADLLDMQESCRRSVAAAELLAVHARDDYIFETVKITPTPITEVYASRIPETRTFPSTNPLGPEATASLG